MTLDIIPSDPALPQEDNAPESPAKIKSKYNEMYVYSRARIAFVILLPILWISYELGQYLYIGFIMLIIPFTVFMLYISFTMRQFFQWEFGPGGFSRKSILYQRKLKFSYQDISTWQIRHRKGSTSRNDHIPNYEEVAIWTTNKKHLTFDEIDFRNYEEMRDYFVSGCEFHGIEMAEYHR